MSISRDNYKGSIEQLDNTLEDNLMFTDNHNPSIEDQEVLKVKQMSTDVSLSNPYADSNIVALNHSVA